MSYRRSLGAGISPAASRRALREGGVDPETGATKKIQEQVEQASVGPERKRKMRQADAETPAAAPDTDEKTAWGPIVGVAFAGVLGLAVGAYFVWKR